MVNTNVLYSVVGRYMVGSSVVGYHIAGNNGNQEAVSRDRLIYLIGKGIIENMRIQANGDEIILRGKGINLNNLPIYDERKNEFRGNEASKNVANTAVTPKKDSGINPMGQFKIIKRIMHKTQCLGYVVEDNSRKEYKFKREKVIELAIQKLISNAYVQRLNEPGQKTPRLILRGASCDLSQLPALIVDSNGNIIDPTVNSSQIKLRAAKMKRGGIIHDRIKNVNMTFESGDYLLVGIKGVVRAVKESDMHSKFVIDKTLNKATCDEYLENLKYYQIEIFGDKVRELSPEQINNWAIVSVKA